uniref:HECT-type E3 ubiquitin transferase n=1 Tax=Meloidogyne enterolobii TaxID=390850 RepID=A0A6V7UCZ2_MELEN|nr:unnamed protein product [Meloidogyne enterolobii]
MVVKCKLIPPVKQPLVETLTTLGYSNLNKNYLNSTSTYSSSSEKPSSISSSNYSIDNNNNTKINSKIESSPPSNSMSASSSSSDNFSKLPKGWEMRVDGQGRIFYIDHIHQKTAWTPPCILEALEESEYFNKNCENICDENRFIRQTMEFSKNNINNNLSIPQTPKQMALNILLSKELFNRLLQSNNFAYELYNESRILKHIIQRIRREPEKFSQFDQNRELVNFINSFTDRTQPLPAGWQLTKQTNSPMPQILFVDHIGKNITPFDPRLAFICLNNKRTSKQEKPNSCQSAPPLRRLNKNSTTTFFGNNITNSPLIQNQRRYQQINNDRLSLDVNVLGQLEKVLNDHYNPQMAQKIKTKLRLIANLGDRALLRYANDVDVARALSLLDQLNEKILKNNEEAQQNENNEKNLNERFLKIIESFHEKLKQLGYAKSQNRLRFRLRRDNLMEDAFQKILCLSPSKLRTYQLMVNFAEEDCLDYGGPSKELFFLLSKQLFNPKNGLFEYTSINSNRIQISPMSKFIDNYLSWMELCGRVLGLALLHRCLLDCFFTKPFYKILAKIPLELNDLLETDNELFNSLNWISKNSISDFELLPNGKNIFVNNENKKEFIELIILWRVERGIRDQLKALLFGLNAVIDQSLLTVFDSEPLEFAISGNIFIDIEDWEKNTVYKGGYRENHVIIRWFWQCVRQMCNADRLKLLQFVTGSASVPFEGFKGLRGSNGLKPFCIERWGNEESLPRAHTCFNRLDLPAYSNKQKMFSKIMLAISESSYYAIE